MACTNRWLANVYAAGGDSEPPPKPNIPTDYVQKPRWRHAPETYPLAPPALADLERHSAALSEIDAPNKKRQRVHNAPAHAMSQTPISPTRRSSRQAGTTGNTGTTTKEATVVEQSLFSRPVPVLTPSMSEEYVNDVDDAEDAELDSMISSKRSRSPTRRMVDLQIAKKPVISKTATSSKDVPQNVRTLYKNIQALALRSKGVIPRGIEHEVDQDANGDLDYLEDYVAETQNAKTYEQLKDEFKAMREIRDETLSCKSKHLHESSWNELVHSQMLKQAVRGRPGFSYYNITTARVIRELVPGNEYGELLKGKMIDYAVTLGPPLLPKANIINRLAASPRKLQRTINPSDYSPLCYEPVGIGIETKSPEGGNEDGEVQLSVWAMAHFNRLRQLVQDPVTMTLPLLLITEARWKLYFASDFVHEVHLIDAVDIGTTANIIGCYTIKEALRVIFAWEEETFVPWFLEGVTPE